MDESVFVTKLKEIERNYDAQLMVYDDFRQARTALLDKFEDALGDDVTQRRPRRVEAAPKPNSTRKTRVVLLAILALALGAGAWMLLSR